MNRMNFGCAALALILVATPAWGAFGHHPVPQGSTDTLIVGWEQRFTLDWSADVTADRASHITGYVINRSGETVDHMRVLAQAYDGSGAVVGKRITWVPGGMSPFGRAYFEIDVPAAARYRVSV